MHCFLLLLLFLFLLFPSLTLYSRWHSYTHAPFVFCLPARFFLQADRDFLKLADRHQLDDGSTAICVYLHDGVCYAANTGDSRCVLASGGQAVAMSSDHKPGERLDEKQRIEALGGKISFYGTWYVALRFSFLFCLLLSVSLEIEYWVCVFLLSSPRSSSSS